MCVDSSMEIPVLKRQVAEKIEMCEFPLLRQYDIPPEIETVASPKPDELEPEDYAEKTVDGMEYVAFKGHWYLSGISGELFSEA